MIGSTREMGEASKVDGGSDRGLMTASRYGESENEHAKAMSQRRDSNSVWIHVVYMV